jgi:hypothetical protein
MANPECNIGLRGNHHPITCAGFMAFDEDGTMRCEHSTASPDNPRTQDCINASIAFLLFELVDQKYNV